MADDLCIECYWLAEFFAAHIWTARVHLMVAPQWSAMEATRKAVVWLRELRRYYFLLINGIFPMLNEFLLHQPLNQI